MKEIDFQDAYWDGRHYDAENEGDLTDFPFYLKQIKKQGDPALELGCGTGRLTIPLTEAGVDIVGIDVMENLLAHARKKAAARGITVNLVNADCRDFHLNRKFNLILFPFNSLPHLTDPESHEALLSRVKEHLTDNGRFVLDIFNTRLESLTRDPDTKVEFGGYPDPDGRGTVVITQSGSYDRATQIYHVRWHYDIGDGAEKFVKDLDLRMFFPQELDALLRYNGFEIEHKYGDFDESEFNSDSPAQIVVCRRR